VQAARHTAARLQAEHQNSGAARWRGERAGAQRERAAGLDQRRDVAPPSQQVARDKRGAHEGPGAADAPRRHGALCLDLERSQLLSGCHICCIWSVPGQQLLSNRPNRNAHV